MNKALKKKASTVLLTLIFISDPRPGALIHQYTFTQLDAIPLVSWYHLLAKLSPKGQKHKTKEHWKKGEGGVESGQEEVFKGNGVH